MSEKTTLPAGPQREYKKSPAMSSPRALLTLAAFLALPFGLIYTLSHCNHFAPSQSWLTPHRSGYRHPHATMQAKQSMLDNIGKLMSEASAAPPNPYMQMRFCMGEDLRECTAYAYDNGCTKVEEGRVLSLSEPRMFGGNFSACTVYRRGVNDCAQDEEGSFQHVKKFVVNWYMPGEEKEYASNGVVPLLQREWISDIGSFKCG